MGSKKPTNVVSTFSPKRRKSAEKQTNQVSQDFAPPLLLILLLALLLSTFLLPPPLALLLLFSLLLTRLPRLVLVPVRVVRDESRVGRSVSCDPGVRVWQVDAVEEVESWKEDRKRRSVRAPRGSEAKGRTDVLDILKVVIVGLVVHKVVPALVEATQGDSRQKSAPTPSHSQSVARPDQEREERRTLEPLSDGCRPPLRP